MTERNGRAVTAFAGPLSLTDRGCRLIYQTGYNILFTLGRIYLQFLISSVQTERVARTAECLRMALLQFLRELGPRFPDTLAFSLETMTSPVPPPL